MNTENHTPHSHKNTLEIGSKAATNVECNGLDGYGDLTILLCIASAIKLTAHLLPVPILGIRLTLKALNCLDRAV